MTITENLTGIAKEDQERPRTVTNILEEVRTEMCDGYCIYPRITPNDYEKYKRICDEECPLNKLQGVIHKWDIKIVRALNAITEEKEKNELNAEESVPNLLHGS